MLRMTALALIVAPLPAAAADFHCRNTDAEIWCATGKCGIETQSFTPMELRRTGSKLSICAYSGCWDGKLVEDRKHGAIELLFAEAHGGLAVIFDSGQAIAQIRWGGFAQVMRCDGAPKAAVAPKPVPDTAPKPAPEPATPPQS